MDRLIPLKKHLAAEKGSLALPATDHLESPPAEPLTFVTAAARGQELGWRMAMVDAEEMVDLEVNFGDGPQVWSRRLAALEAFGGRLGLGVYTGRASGLLILEVASAAGTAELNRYGPWRSPCCTRVASGREQHYYALPPGSPPIPTCFLVAPQVMVFGEDGLALVPPSKDVQSQEVWSWLTPPWEHRPPDVPEAVWAFLREQLPAAVKLTKEPQVPSWDEVYREILPYKSIITALLAPAASPSHYYQELLQAALDAGLRDRSLLLGLLWHAPQVDRREKYKGWEDFQRLVAEALEGLPENGGNPQNGEPPCQKHHAEAPQNGQRPWPAYQVNGPTACFPEAERGVWLNYTPAVASPQPGNGKLNRHSSLFPVDLREWNLDLLAASLCQKTSQEACRPSPEASQDREELPFVWTRLPKVTTTHSPKAIQDTMQAYLEKNPDLSADPFKVQMVHYCFKNYVSVDPDLADLSLQERVERATLMAREFLGICRKY